MAAGGRAGLVVLVAVLATVTWSGAAAPSAPNDAGSGRDAPHTSSAALRIPGDGSYAASAATADRDWFVAAGTGRAACLVLDTSTAEPRAARLAAVAADGTVRTVNATVADGERMVVATPDASQSYVAYGGAALADYAFVLSTRAPAGDAASDLGVPTWLPSSCTAGTLSGESAIDRYTFAAEQGDVAHLSLASTDPATRLAVRDPAGVLAALAVSGDVLTFAFPTSGTYTLEASSPAAASYLLGSFLGDPGGQPCRPNCRSLAE